MKSIRNLPKGRSPFFVRPVVRVGQGSLVVGLLLAVMLPSAMPATEYEELRDAYFAVAAEQRASATPDPDSNHDPNGDTRSRSERAGELAELLRPTNSSAAQDGSSREGEGGEVQSGARFDSAAALREAARILLPQLTAARGATPSGLSHEEVNALQFVIDPGAARRVLNSSSIDPVLELGFERIAVLYEQQSHLQRIEFTRHVNVPLDRYRAVAAITRQYAVRSAAWPEGGAAGPEPDALQREMLQAAEMPPVEAAIAMLGSPELRQLVDAADPSSPAVENVTAGLTELYEQVDRAVASMDLSEAGYHSPRVELLRPRLGAGRLSEWVIPYRRTVAVSGIASGEGEQRRILPYEVASELYYAVFYDLSYAVQADIEVPESFSELWGRLHGQYVVAAPAGDSASQSLEERFVAELEPEFRMRDRVKATPSAEAFARELNDSILRTASRIIERPMSRLGMQPELYLGTGYRQLQPAHAPAENYSVVRRVLTELEEDVLAERRYLHTVAEQQRSDAISNSATAGTEQ